MSKQDNSRDAARDAKVLAAFPRTRARFGLRNLLNGLEAKGLLRLDRPNDAQRMTFEEWRASRPIRIDE